MTEDKTQRVIARGKKAKILLEDETVAEALESLKRDAVEAMMTCPSERLGEFRARVTALEDLRRKLVVFMNDGKIALDSLSN